MKKSDLKKLIKPIVKECIHETLIEEGLLSNIVSEVAVGLSTQSPIVENRQPPTTRSHKKADSAAQTRKLMDSIGKDAYNGVNLFEGTDPMTQYEAAEPKGGSVDLGNPADSGVDIGSLVGDASKIWQAMK
jgi:hypothetical protein